MDAGQRPITIPHLSTSYSGELKTSVSDSRSVYLNDKLAMTSVYESFSKKNINHQNDYGGIVLEQQGVINRGKNHKGGKVLGAKRPVTSFPLSPPPLSSHTH